MDKVTDPVRCGICGKTIEADGEEYLQADYRVMTKQGKPHAGRIRPWGSMHMVCFARVVGGPTAVLAALKAAASKAHGKPTKPRKALGSADALAPTAP